MFAAGSKIVKKLFGLTHFVESPYFSPFGFNLGKMFRTYSESKMCSREAVFATKTFINNRHIKM